MFWVTVLTFPNARMFQPFVLGCIFSHVPYRERTATMSNEKRKRLTILTGSGMSAESGLATFRDAGGLWENYNVTDVASIDGWERNPQLVTAFYNARRAQLAGAEPNDGHRGLAELEKSFTVRIITQNVDNLHERAGSPSVLHLHGKLTSARCTGPERHTVDIGYRAMDLAETCGAGHRLRPDIVWFGEEVPAMDEAVRLVESADVFAIIGTSLAVYPAASLIEWVPQGVPVFVIDPVPPNIYRANNITVIPMRAVEGVAAFAERIKRYL